MRTLCFTHGSIRMQVDIIQLKLFQFADKLVRTGCRLLLKLSSYHLHRGLFYQVFGDIRSYLPKQLGFFNLLGSETE